MAEFDLAQTKSMEAKVEANAREIAKHHDIFHVHDISRFLHRHDHKAKESVSTAGKYELTTKHDSGETVLKEGEGADKKELARNQAWTPEAMGLPTGADNVVYSAAGGH